MYSKLALIIAVCCSGIGCRQEATETADNTQTHVGQQTLTQVQLGAPGLSKFEETRGAYVDKRLLELPNIDNRIHQLEVAASVEHGPRKADTIDILPDVHSKRAAFGQDLERAKAASAGDFEALRAKIDKEDSDLDISLRAPGP